MNKLNVEYKRIADEFLTSQGTRRPSEKALESIGDKLDDLAQRIEQERAWEAARKRSREEWERMEYEYVHHRTQVSYEDLYAYILDLIEWNRITPQVGRKRLAMLADNYVTCGFSLCRNVFPAKSNKQYCCRTCKDDQRTAEKRYRENAKRFNAPTYLPESAYIPRLVDSERRAYEENEFAVDPLDESDNGNSNSMLDVCAHVTGKRDEMRTIRDINGDYRRRDRRKKRRRGRTILRVGIKSDEIVKDAKYFGD